MNNHRSQKTTRLITWLLIAALLTTGWLGLQSATVSADAPQQDSANGLIAPTSTPQPANQNSSPGVSPLVGILVLLAPLGYLVWKSRGLKEPKIRSSCCLPVIDENQRPFQIQEDEPASEKESTN